MPSFADSVALHKLSPVPARGTTPAAALDPIFKIPLSATSVAAFVVGFPAPPKSLDNQFPPLLSAFAISSAVPAPIVTAAAPLAPAPAAATVAGFAPIPSALLPRFNKPPKSLPIVLPIINFPNLKVSLVMRPTTRNIPKLNTPNIPPTTSRLLITLFLISSNFFLFPVESALRTSNPCMVNQPPSNCHIKLIKVPKAD